MKRLLFVIIFLICLRVAIDVIPVHSEGFVDNWVIGDKAGLNPEFLQSLATLGRGIGQKVSITSGYRSMAEQQKLWDESDKTGKWVKKPGESKHNVGLAVDVGNKIIKEMTNAQLAKYGLYKPMDYEQWHLEPISQDK